MSQQGFEPTFVVVSLEAVRSAAQATGGYLRTDYVRGTFEAMLSSTD